VQRLRTENEIHKRCAFADALAFLTGNTATDTDHDPGATLLVFAPSAKLGKDFLLCFLANRAGIDQQQVASSIVCVSW
jgi:hypothetical protein